MKEEAELDVNEEPILNSYYQSSILSHDSLESTLANYLANRLSSASLPSNTLFDLFVGILKSDQEIMDSVKDDLKTSCSKAMASKRKSLGSYDPELSFRVIGNNVSIFHSVTLGGTGKASGDRYPKIGDAVLIGAGTCILGNIKVGECAKIGAGSVVITDVPPRTTVVSDFVMLLF
ncbi:hypothetical protein AHAS_Ahas15G0123300 [Arachis hypogaea]